MLCKMLKASDCAGNPESYFHQSSVDSWLKTCSLEAEEFSSEREKLQAIFSTVQIAGHAGTDIFGLRMQQRSFGFFLDKLAILHPNSPNDTCRIAASFGSTLFIHLTRHNKIEQAVSHLKAEQSGLWHKSSNGQELERLSPAQELRYDPIEINRLIAEMTQNDIDWHTWFNSQGIEPLRLSYENLSNTPKSALSKILQALDLDPTIAQKIDPPTAKLADRLSLEWAERYISEIDWTD